MLSFTGGLFAVAARNVAYVLTDSPDTISVVDLASNTVTNTISGINGFAFLAFTPDGSQAWVPLFKHPGQVDIIDTLTSVLSDSVSVGSFGTGIAFNAAGTKVYIANIGGSNVTIVDVATQSLITTISVGTSPHGLAFSPDGTKVYVANAAGNSMSIINAVTQTLSSTIPVGTDPHLVAFTTDGSKAYVTNRNSNNISIIDVALGSVSSVISSGGTRPSGIVLTSTKAYVTNVSSNNVTVIDLASNTVVNTISVGTNPLEIALSPDGTRAYVANFTSKSVSVIDLALEQVIDTISFSGAPLGVATARVPAAQTISVTGSCKQNRFLTQTTFYNELSWGSATGAIAYRVYRDAAFTLLVEETRQLSLIDPNRSFSTDYTYYVVSVDSLGDEALEGQITIQGCPP